MNATERAGQVMMYGGGAGALWFGWDVATWASVLGVAIAFGGLCVTVYFMRRRDRREQEAHERQMALYGEH